MTHDAQKAREFYGTSLGWKFDEMTMESGGTYLVAMDGEKPLGGIFQMEGPDHENVPDHWFAYIAVDDIDARLKQAVENGATLLRAAFDVPGVGRIGLIKDPCGASIGWMTPAQNTDG
ncbi:MAG: VOC family protein [Stappiaceae bacterium]